MFLTLEAHGASAAALGGARRKTFSAQGGTIGRRPGNDWVLADPHVSSRHARVRNINGTFFLEDSESANGVYVNGTRLHAGEPYPLKEGDEIFIDPFEIRASITLTKPGVATEMLDQAPPVPPPSAATPQNVEPPLIDSPPVSEAPLIDDASIPASVDPLDLLGGAPPPSSSAPTANDLGRVPIINEPYRPPPPGPSAIPMDWTSEPAEPARHERAAPPAAGASGIPDDWRRTNLQAPPPKAPPPPIPKPAPSPRAAAPVAPPQPSVPPPRPSAPPAEQAPPITPAIASDFDALLRGAGISEASVSPEVIAQFGEVLRIVVEGLMEVLRARGEIKNEFRLRQTMFKPRENNPLKFSANVEDALHNLLVKKNAAYLDTPAAFADAFDDVRHHQIAMLAGVRAAFETMLDRFEPQRLREQFDSAPGRKPHLGFGGRGRYWDMYEEFFRAVTSDADDAFRRLFGDRFGQAYEAELERLRSSRRSGGHR